MKLLSNIHVICHRHTFRVLCPQYIHFSKKGAEKRPEGFWLPNAFPAALYKAALHVFRFSAFACFVVSKRSACRSPIYISLRIFFSRRKRIGSHSFCFFLLFFFCFLLHASLRSRQQFLLFCSKARKNATVNFFTVTSEIRKIYFICLRQWNSCLTVYVFYGQRPSRGPTGQERINKYLASKMTSGPHQKSVRLVLPSLLFFIFAKYNFANSIIT